MSKRTGIVYSAEFQKHITGPGHPERPERVQAVIDALKGAPFWPELTLIEPKRATEEQILRCHSRAYFDIAKRDVASGASMLSTGDTNISRESFEIAMLAAGGIIQAIEKVCAGELKNAFCAVRPPGHHATHERGMGFCLFDNIAIGARHAQSKHGIGRVLIVDWDVHHGNGTEDIFYRDGMVLFFDTHQHPLYPGTGAAEERGAGPGEGFTINCPLPAGTSGKEILAVYEEKLLPAAKKFKPDLVMISAGFDSRIGDPLGGFRVTDEEFIAMTNVVLGIAKEFAGGKVVSVLEGGYSLIGLAKAATAHAGALAAAN